MHTTNITEPKAALRKLSPTRKSQPYPNQVKQQKKQANTKCTNPLKYSPSKMPPKVSEKLSSYGKKEEKKKSPSKEIPKIESKTVEAQSSIPEFKTTKEPEKAKEENKSQPEKPLSQHSEVKH